MSTEQDTRWQQLFDMFKLDYEQASQRYENIYRAIWQIFQYMAVLSAGILTFGSKFTDFSSGLIVFIALSPLVFWFLATYIPMDRYGEKTGEYLKKIEESINCEFGEYWQFEQYKSFLKQKNANNSNNFLYLLFSRTWRVKNAVHIFGILLLLTWLISSILTIHDIYLYAIKSSPISNNIKLQLEPVEVTLPKSQIDSLTNTLSNFSQDLSRIDRKQDSLKDIKDTLNTLSQKIDSLESRILKVNNSPAGLPTNNP